MSETTLTQLEEQCLSITTDMTVEQVMEIRERLMFAETRVKEAKASLNAALMEYIDAHGPFVVGNTRFYNGVKKTTRCMSVPRCVEALLTETGGDFDEFCKVLGSQPIKPGAAEGILGDEWDEHFEVIGQQDVKTGKPKRETKAVDTRFLPGS